MEDDDVKPNRQFFWRYVFSLQLDPGVNSVRTFRSYISMAKKWFLAKKGWEISHDETKRRIKAVGKRLLIQSMFFFYIVVFLLFFSSLVFV